MWRKRLPLFLLLAGVLLVGLNYARHAPRPLLVTYHYGALAPRVQELQVRYLQGDPGQEGEMHRALFRYADGRAPSSQTHRFQLPSGPTTVRLRLLLAGGAERALTRHLTVPEPALLKLSGQEGPHEISLDLSGAESERGDR
jgi:hypothetical protein